MFYALTANPLMCFDYSARRLRGAVEVKRCLSVTLSVAGNERSALFKRAARDPSGLKVAELVSSRRNVNRENFCGDVEICRG